MGNSSFGGDKRLLLGPVQMGFVRTVVILVALGASIINLGATSNFPISHIAVNPHIVAYCERKEAAFLGSC